MQTLILNNEKLAKQIKDLETRINSLVASKPVKAKPKGGKFKTIKGLKGLFGGGSSKVKYYEVVNNIHALILKQKFDDADSLISENKKLIDKKTDAKLKQYDLQDEYGETVLLKAVRSGKTELTLALIQRGVGPDISDDQGETPLMVAAKYGQLEIVEALVKTANKDVKTTYTKRTALHYAAASNHMDIVKALLGFGCDPRIEDSDGHVPSSLADDKAIVRILKREENVLNEVPVDDEAEEAADKAEKAKESKQRSYSGDEEMRPLYEEKAKLEKKLHLLEMQFEDLKKRRLPADATNELARLRNLDDKEKKKFLGMNQLDQVIEEYHNFIKQGDDDGVLEKLEAFLDKHTHRSAKKKGTFLDINAADEFGETALMKAARLGYTQLASFLILYKCNPDMRDLEGHTALMKAAQFGKAEVVEKLLEEGVELNASSRNGKRTALMLAAERGHGKICEMLVAEGADYKLKDSAGKQAVDLATNPDAKAVLENTIAEYPLKQTAVQI